MFLRNTLFCKYYFDIILLMSKLEKIYGLDPNSFLKTVFRKDKNRSKGSIFGWLQEVFWTY